MYVLKFIHINPQELYNIIKRKVSFSRFSRTIRETSYIRRTDNEIRKELLYATL